MEITRGDTKRLKFQRRLKKNLQPITTIPDQLYFTVKYSEQDKNFIFQKTLNNDIKFNVEDNYYYFTINPSDTDNLPYINLFYDIQVNDKGIKKTIAIGELNITHEVTFVNNESEYNKELQDDSDSCVEEIVTIEETDVIMNTDYSILENKPSINGVTLKGNKTNDELNLVTKVIEVDKGTSAILNTDTGGQLLFLTKDKKRANVSVNDGEADIYVQLSSTDIDTNEGARITLDNNKAYYTSGNTYKFNPKDEIVTKKDIPSDLITKDFDGLTYYTKTEDLERDYAKKDEIPSTDEFITKSVYDLDNYELKENVGNKLELSLDPNNYVLTAKLNNSDGNNISTQEIDLPLEEMVINATYDNETKEIKLELKNGNTTSVPVADLVNGLATTDDLDEETRDLLQTLSRELKPDEENGGFSSQTIVNVKNKSGATETIMEIDNLDVKTDVPTNSVLGTQKGIDMDERIKNLEEMPIKVIEISSEMSNDDKINHIYPNLELDEDQLKIILNNNISILKVKYNITERSNGAETDTLVFYTTIDDEKVISGNNTIHTIKINAIRRNDEGILVYHGEMVGNGEEYYTNIQLTPTWK